MVGAVWRYAGWIPVAIVLGPAWTAVHEAAHAFFAIAQGGAVLDWSVIPGYDPEGNFRFGYVSNALVGSQTLVLLGPTIASLAIAFPAAIALRWTPPGKLSRFLFLMGVIFPLGDLSLSVAGMVLGRSDADLARVLGAAPLVPALVLLAAMTVAGLLARRAFDRHFQTGLTLAEYVLLGAVVIGAPWIAGVAIPLVAAAA
jgi:hypothetical protein